MKVLLIVTEKLPVPPVRGGAIQTYIAGIAPQLARHHDLTILGRTDPLLPDHEVADGITFDRVPGGHFELYRQGVVSYLDGKQFDLIHIFNRPLMVSAVRQAAPNARLILSMHNDMFLPNKITAEEAKLAIADAERIVTVSDYVGRTISNLYPEAAPKLKTIYSGVDLNRYLLSTEAQRVRQELRDLHGLNGKKVILFVGRLSPKKGADILLRSLPQLADKHPDAALVMVGSRWYSDDNISDYVAYVRALAARSPIPVVTTGFVDAAEVHKWFWAGDVFVCPSQWQEPLARVHYEAMAAELPIVTTRRGGNPEVIDGQNGIVIDNPEDPASFAAAISDLLHNATKRRDFGKHGRVLAERNYGWERVIREILEVWSG
ncbi:glycosyltransferase family 4 protein [Tumebacillus flagellatus]|uniref:Lipopolysaccharide N-acetylglucosaminyltransferase n=1 Tax=Tumebacillus flagellatus TaxID=1157490 RepID=A0A074MC69_9BACL|nr:glycosyltransferase family 4 protein [Tumebacillus flagellatus]KEO83487.1 lipopolysaccharide N-acetylglucosaminyltransferase [Tumebacillus flagellatus]